MVERVLDGEANVTIKIYISDELDEPACFQIGNGECELVFAIEEDGIDYEWTKKTLWRKIKDFFSKVLFHIVKAFLETCLSKLIMKAIRHFFSNLNCDNMCM